MADAEVMRRELLADLDTLEKIDATEQGDVDDLREEIRDTKRQIESLEDDLYDLERRLDSLEACKCKALTARDHGGRVRQAIEILRSHGREHAAAKLQTTLDKWSRKGAQHA